MLSVWIILFFASLAQTAVMPLSLDSCSTRCNDGYSSAHDCQCNTHCVTYGDCCTNYKTVCQGNGPDPVTSAEMTILANQLWSVDVNRASSSQFTINKQTYLSNYKDRVDKSNSSLIEKVDASLLTGDTYASFIALLDNYVTRTGTDESTSVSEQVEIDAFLTAIMKTSVMTKTYDFLYAKRYVSSSQDFQDKIEEMWFTMYGRSSSADSSGFEHVFVGEQKSSNTASGFHSWIQLYHEEQYGALNYYGYVKESSPNLLLFQFQWEGTMKDLSSVMFGSSPEFEMALFSTCFLTHPNKMCSFTLDGNSISIQTYDFKGANLIGSAYFSI